MKLGSLPWLAASLCALALSACNSNTGADGYAFKGKEFDRPQVIVTTVTHASIADLRRAASTKDTRVEPGSELMAFAIVNSARNICELHLVDPVADYSPEWLGHEFAHCLYGRWHEQHPAGKGGA